MEDEMALSSWAVYVYYGKEGDTHACLRHAHLAKKCAGRLARRQGKKATANELEDALYFNKLDEAELLYVQETAIEENNTLDKLSHDIAHKTHLIKDIKTLGYDWLEVS
jgi:hypothetical protein